MVILCAECAASLLLPGRFAASTTDEPGETIDLTVECMECGKEITVKMLISPSLDRPAIRKLKRA
jgi:hypothetical protein